MVVTVRWPFIFSAIGCLIIELDLLLHFFYTNLVEI